MKTNIFPALWLGLVLAGCGQTKAAKISAAGPPNSRPTAARAPIAPRGDTPVAAPGPDAVAAVAAEPKSAVGALDRRTSLETDVFPSAPAAPASASADLRPIMRPTPAVPLAATAAWPEAARRAGR